MRNYDYFFDIIEGDDFMRTCEEGDILKFLKQYPSDKLLIWKKCSWYYIMTNGLEKACQNGNLLIVKELLKYVKPTPNCLKTKNTEIVKELLKHNNFETHLINLCYLEYDEVIKEILKDPRIKDPRINKIKYKTLRCYRYQQLQKFFFNKEIKNYISKKFLLNFNEDIKYLIFENYLMTN